MVVNVCKICEKEFTSKSLRDYCSNSCYYKHYYNENRERLLANRKQYAKEHYIPHPKPRKYNSEEERIEAQKNTVRNIMIRIEKNLLNVIDDGTKYIEMMKTLKLDIR